MSPVFLKLMPCFSIRKKHMQAPKYRHCIVLPSGLPTSTFWYRVDLKALFAPEPFSLEMSQNAAPRRATASFHLFPPLNG